MTNVTRRFLFPGGLLAAGSLIALVHAGVATAESATSLGPLGFLVVLSALELGLGRWTPALKRLPRDLTLFVVSGALDAGARALAATLAVLVGEGGFGPAAGAPVWLSIPIALAVADLVAYGVHRSFHAHPTLWRMHVLHHAPTELYALMSSVNAPLMVLCVRALPLIALVACGFPPIVLVAYALLDAWIGLCSHTGVDTWNPWLRKLFVTPEVHRVHHSADPSHSGNHALAFTLWDRVFGTFHAAGATSPAPGLHEPDVFPTEWSRQLLLRKRACKSASQW